MTKTERENLMADIWDLYKELNGIRPRWLNWSLISDDDVKAMHTRLVAEAEADWNDFKARRDSLEIARTNPDAIIFMTRSGEELAELGEEVDPTNPDYWSFYIKPQFVNTPLSGIARLINEANGN